MQTKTHRKWVTLLSAVTLIAAITFYSCEKESADLAPTLTLLGTTGSITGDTQAEMGDTMHFHLRAKQGSDKLLTFLIKINGQTIKDSTYSSEGFELHLDIIKGADTLEVIEFIVRDRKSREAKVTVNATLVGGVSWGPVVRYSGIELGAQDNSSVGGFYSIADSSVRNLADAFQNQELIDLIYYFEAGDDNTMGSPGANIDASIFTGPYALSQWTTIRTTRFKKINITSTDFQQCNNDSLLIASYGLSDGNRKAKNLAAGHYYSFKTEDDITGIFYVNSVTGSESGTIVIDLIAQRR